MHIAYGLIYWYSIVKRICNVWLMRISNLWLTRIGNVCLKCIVNVWLKRIGNIWLKCVMLAHFHVEKKCFNHAQPNTHSIYILVKRSTSLGFFSYGEL